MPRPVWSLAKLKTRDLDKDIKMIKICKGSKRLVKFGAESTSWLIEQSSSSTDTDAISCSPAYCKRLLSDANVIFKRQLNLDFTKKNINTPISLSRDQLSAFVSTINPRILHDYRCTHFESSRQYTIVKKHILFVSRRHYFCNKP